MTYERLVVPAGTILALLWSLLVRCCARHWYGVVEPFVESFVVIAGTDCSDLFRPLLTPLRAFIRVVRLFDEYTIR